MKRSKKKRTRPHRFPRWQKVWFIISVVCLAAVLALGLFRAHTVRSLYDQNEAQRWTQGGGRAAQVSCFYAYGSTVTEETVRQLNYTISKGLTDASMKAASDDANLFIWCASGMGSTQITFEDKESSVTAIGVLGDFFEFHQFRYLSGGPFLTDSEMRDQIIIDEYTAWKLFGSTSVVGQTVQIGGVNHLISGVIRRPSGYFARQAGITDSSSVCIMSYKSLLQYTSESQSSDENGQNSNENGQNINGSGDDSGAENQSPEGRLDTDPARRAGQISFLENILSIPVQAADTDTDIASEGSETSSGGSADTQEGAAQTADTAGSGASQESGTGAAASESSSGTETTASESGTQAPAAQSTQENAQSEEIGTQNTNYTDSGRISCYEAVMPEPVDGFAARTVRSNAGSTSDVSVVDNTSRYTTASLLADLREFTQRSMQVSGYTLPYWENIARGWETVLAMIVLLQIILLGAVILFVIFVLIYYFRHKTWTASNTFAKIKDRIYDRQSRARYGKGQKIEGLSTLTDSVPAKREPDEEAEEQESNDEEAEDQDLNDQESRDTESSQIKSEMREND